MAMHKEKLSTRPNAIATLMNLTTLPVIGFSCSLHKVAEDRSQVLMSLVKSESFLHIQFQNSTRFFAFSTAIILRRQAATKYTTTMM